MNPKNDGDIEAAIQERSKDISTDFLAMSIGEIASLYENDELNIHPEFQRFFRWDENQKSNLIESILLGIPVPPIFVAQTGEGIWELVDGLQRISTLLELMGLLQDENGNKLPPLTLEKTMYLPQLEGKSWNNSDETKELPQSVKLRIRRARIDIKIVLSKSEESVKYELFRRLNTGGSIATDQEVRNCLLIMTSKSFFEWFDKLSKNSDFTATLPISERSTQEAYDLELLTRFITLHNIDLNAISKDVELGSFLTQSIMESAKLPKNWRNETEKVFLKTFALLNEALGEDAFKKYNKEKKSGTGAVLISVFEVMAIGLGYALRSGKIVSPEVVRDVHHSLWENKNFTSAGGSGISAKTRLPKTLKIGRELFA